MVIRIKEVSFSHVKQKGFGEKIHSHNGVFFFNVDTGGVKQLQPGIEAPVLVSTVA